jgi:putative aminopeptidase FrvX
MQCLNALPDVHISAADRTRHHRWLQELTSLPTVAGHEHTVIAWIKRWLSASRPPYASAPTWSLHEDRAGNLLISAASNHRPEAPRLLIAAHLDHPGFVVRRVVAPSVLELEFRGGVMPAYFEQSRVCIHLREQGRLSGFITQRVGRSELGGFETFLCELNSNAGEDARPGDVATWDLPHAEILDGLLHAPACDDLSAVAACLAVLDILQMLDPARFPALGQVSVLFTRAEEIGFIGAIAACKDKTIPAGARILMIENSRSFDESPIGGGPIVRVGDRLSVFSPGLTGAVCKRAEDLVASNGWPSSTTQAAPQPVKWAWQRKLMPGGACEASVYQAYGYDSTCLCLPLGNYHNMGNLAQVQAGQASPDLARIEPEINSIRDFDGLVDLLIACAIDLPTAQPMTRLIDDLWKSKAFVLDESQSRASMT